MKFPSLPAFLAMALLPLTTSSARIDSPAPTKLGSTVFDWEHLTATPTNVGMRRDVARNPTATLEEFECHFSTLNAGQRSHAPHRHPQEELIVLLQGAVEVFINGQEHHASPGSLFFFASGDLHALRNATDAPALYCVFNFTTAATHQVKAEPAAGRLGSAVFDWNQLEATPTKSGLRRAVFDAPTATCTKLESHVTTLNPGESPHPLHHHPDEELILVKEGTLEATINGTARRAGAGSIFLFASNDEHGLKNIGSTPATYYVLRVATEATPKSN